MNVIGTLQLYKEIEKLKAVLPYFERAVGECLKHILDSRATSFYVGERG